MTYQSKWYVRSKIRKDGHLHVTLRPNRDWPTDSSILLCFAEDVEEMDRYYRLGKSYKVSFQTEEPGDE